MQDLITSLGKKTITSSELNHLQEEDEKIRPKGYTVTLMRRDFGENAGTRPIEIQVCL
ncbi:hypothetical protein SOVF_102630 [Spinacia oleracea]|nr:hypothetical protein SOVF_102630 [Spinacia oleracea]